MIKRFRILLLGWLLLNPGLWTPTAWATTQVILGGGGATTLSASAARGLGLTDDAAATSTVIQAEGIVSTGGAISQLYVLLDTAPDTGAGTQTYTFALYIDGSATALTCTISEAATSCTDVVNSVAVVAAGRAMLHATPSGTPAVATASYSVLFTSTTSAESLLLGGSLSNTMNTNNFFPLHAADAGDSTDTFSETLMPTAGTIKNLYINKTDPGVGNSFIFTVNKNSTGTALTCTIAAGATTCADTSNSFTVVAGDAIVLAFTESGTPTDTRGKWGVTFVASTAGQFIIADSNSGTTTNSATSYNVLNGDDNAWNATRTSIDQIAQAMTLKAIYVEANAAPGVGTSYDLTLWNGASSTALTCQIAGAVATTCNLTTDVTIANSDLLVTESVPAGTPTARNMNISYLGFNSEGAATRRVLMLTQGHIDERGSVYE